MAERGTAIPGEGGLEDWLGREVVVDVAAPTVVLGRLARISADALWLTDADVHDMAAGTSSKERYVLEARKHGIRRNRAAVWVRFEQVVAVSLLEDVVVY